MRDSARKILIVDDDDNIREIVRACLEDICGWETLSTASCQEALQQIRVFAPDAVLLDISMPDIDGFTCSQKLRKQCPNVPIAILTARVQRGDRDRLDELGITGFLVKPFDPLTLGSSLARVLGWED